MSAEAAKKIKPQSLYNKHRPLKLDGVVGQDKAVNAIRKALVAGTLPHSILLNGPTGTGKTTLMRIIRRALKCGDRDYKEINTADFRGIDTIRDIRQNLHLQPWGASKVIGIDECHMLSKDAQNAILKMLEDTPDHAYFVLGTTDPQKLLPAILGRCTEYKLRTLDEDEILVVLSTVCEREQFEVSQDILQEIAESSGGSARKALVILEAVAKEEGDEAQQQAIQITTVNKDLAFKLGYALMWGKGGWNEIAGLLREMKDEDPEGVRYVVLGFARNQLVGKEGKAPEPRNMTRAASVINFFGTNFYDSKQAGLAFACFNVIHSK